MGRLKFTRAGLQKMLADYFDDTESIKSLAGLAVFLCIDSKLLTAMLQDGSSLSEQLNIAKTHIEKDIVENGLRGKYNAAMSSFLLKTCFGYSEKAEQPLAGDFRVEVADELKKFAV